MNRAPDEPLPAHVTTPLLTLITTRSLDEDYAHVASRKAAVGAERPERKGPRWTTVAAVLVLGLLTSVVVAQTSREAATHELSRAALGKQIGIERDRVASLQDEVASLVDANQATAARNATLENQLENLQAGVQRLGVLTGFTAVHGEGVRISVDNPESADSTTEIRDEDLATLVDGLWAAGAEAVSIDGQRVNALGGIRNISRAVHVNGRPVTAPYLVVAIGDQRTLQARLLETSQGQEWFARVNGLSFRYTAQNVDDVEVPAAPLRALRHTSQMTRPGGRTGGEETAP